MVAWQTPLDWLRGDATGDGSPADRRRRCDVLIVGGGFTGLWTALALTDTDPGAAGRRPRGGDRRVRGDRPERRLLRGVADPRPGQRDPPLPGRARAARGRGARQPARADRVHARPRDRVRPRGDRHADRGRPALPGRRVPGLAGRGGRARGAPRVHGPDRGPGRGPLAALAGRALSAAGARRPARSGGAVPRPGARRPSARLRIHEHTRVTGLDPRGGWGRVDTAAGVQFRAAHVVVATSAYSGWLRRLRAVFVPVYDYVLVSEPLTPDERRSIGWQRRQGLSDANNQFHYFRLTADDRILWGGYDAIHYFGSRVGAGARRPAGRRSDRLEAQFFRAFPQLGGAALPVPLGRRDRHDDAVHGDLRPDDGWPGDLCARLHGSGRRRESLGGRRRPRLHPAPGRGPAPAADRAEPAGPLPARAAALGGGRTSCGTSSTGRIATRAAARSCCSGRSTRSGIGFDS